MNEEFTVDEAMNYEETYENVEQEKFSPRLYQVRNGDVFTIEEKSFWDAYFLNPDLFHKTLFVMRRFKRIVWYKPSTWRKWYLRIAWMEE